MFKKKRKAWDEVVINRKRAQRNVERGSIKNKRELNVWKQGKIEYCRI
jgi:hypothetical protein